ncbi:hypothetical protein SKAU_G00290350 [Synaphobranchus kaupii]|uniref:Uncharacterized protein n=1 Tax=Synaphobranchus kaupii TaxID=118154 RepID=A0A9Q1ETK9_SYNKA|nr:hypothetical protein SKAU_G00290350 [Synaphobranchus kaupii]
MLLASCWGMRYCCQDHRWSPGLLRDTGFMRRCALQQETQLDSLLRGSQREEGSRRMCSQVAGAGGTEAELEEQEAGCERAAGVRMSRKKSSSKPFTRSAREKE